MGRCVLPHGSALSQFGVTVPEMFNFLQSREVDTSRILELAVPDINYATMTVEETLVPHTHQE